MVYTFRINWNRCPSSCRFENIRMLVFLSSFFSFSIDLLAYSSAINVRTFEVLRSDSFKIPEIIRDHLTITLNVRNDAARIKKSGSQTLGIVRSILRRCERNPTKEHVESSFGRRRVGTLSYVRSLRRCSRTASNFTCKSSLPGRFE